MSDHIGSFLNLKCCIVEASHKLDDILVIHAILHSLPYTNIWDVVRRNLLDKGKGLTLDILTAELISVHDYSKRDRLADKNDKKLKSEQMALFTKSASSSTYFGKKPWRGKLNDKPLTCPTGTKCHICGKEGHWAPECHSKSVWKDTSYHAEGSANLAIECLPSLGEREVSRILMALSDTISSTGILLDCGATFHMFMYRKYFTNYTKSSNEFVTVGGRNWVPVAGRGSINFSALLPNGRLSIILHNVLHIPHLGANLVSLGTLHQQGVSVRSLDNSLALSKDGEELFRASLTHSASTLYNIQCTPPTSNITYLAKSLSNMHLQYHCMGHLHPCAINPRYCQYSVKSLEASKKKVNQSVDNTIIKDITSAPNEIDIPAITKNSPFLSTTPLPNIPEISASSTVVAPTRNSPPSFPQHSGRKRKSGRHLALFTPDNVTTGTANAAFIAEANKLGTHQEVTHSPHLKQWESAVQSSHDYVICDSSSSSMAYLKGGRVWAAGVNSSRDFFKSP